MLFTVFTPTYNRAALLPRLFHSLETQSFRDFEWFVVDDGSTDDTTAVMNGLIAKAEFPVRYLQKPNGGKHTAINMGVRNAQGELFFILDSDDELPPDSLSIVADVYSDVKDTPGFAGVCGLDATFDGHIIGSGLPEETVDSSGIEVRFKMGVTGDMKEVFRTSVMREFPFPEIQSERFCPEILVWNRIAARYKLRYFNRVIYLAEYQPEGITAAITLVRMQSPAASMMTYSEMTRLAGIPFRARLRAAINYWRFRLCRRPSTPRVPIGHRWMCAFLPGLLLHLNDVRTLS